MAKKNTVEISSVLETLKHNAARKGGARIKNRKYAVNIPESLENIRLAPQAIAVVGVILEQEKPEITEVEIFTAVGAAKDQLGSKQTPWRVFQYYKKAIIEAGFITEIDG